VRIDHRPKHWYEPRDEEKATKYGGTRVDRFCVVSGRALYDAVSGGLGSTGAAYWRRKTGGVNLYCNGG